MEKIVVLSSGSEHDNNLIECLKALFPECEIDIQTRKSANDNDTGSAAENSDNSNMDEMLEKYLSFL